MENSVAKPSTQRFIVEGPNVHLTAEPTGFRVNPQTTCYYAFQAAGKTVRIVIQKTGDRPVRYVCTQPATKEINLQDSAILTTTTIDCLP
uniref:Uncharacterized protein n=1 Tax=Neospora caninum (strain Liverpool) TaxID=572307 RepID=A0A0F7UGQ3_NEOCL|nr:TPA: hypothetical protein BN1204_035215 [Neospora caninum Liverpool]